MQHLSSGSIVSSLPLLCPLDVSPELCFDVSSDLQLSSILSSQNRHLSILMHQGTFLPPTHSSPATFYLSCVFLHFNSAALSNCNPVWWFQWPRAPCCEQCHMRLPLFIKLTQARLRRRPLPAPRPCTLQSIFARNPELLRGSMVVRASITWNIQGAWRLPWGAAQGFYSDLIIRHDFFMSYDSPVELESALNLCDSHGSQRGGGAGCPLPWLCH